MKSILTFFILLFLFTGCTKQPQLTRAEWLQNTVKTYTNISKEKAISSAEKVLRLADGNDFIIAHNEKGFNATRNWLVYLVLAASTGTDFWRVEVEELQNNKVKVTLQVNSQSQAITPMITSSGAWTATSGTLAGTPVQGNSIYSTFWKRFEYLIGSNDKWMTCKQSNELNDQGKTWGNNEALCNSFNVDDNIPNNY